MPYTVEAVDDHWRISDPEDNHLATCYDRRNAELVCRALNALDRLDALMVAGDAVAGELRDRCSFNGRMASRGRAADAYKAWTEARGKTP
jgi:hypothetical protein